MLKIKNNYFLKKIFKSFLRVLCALRGVFFKVTIKIEAGLDPGCFA